MNNHFRKRLLAHTLKTYEIGYLLLGPDLVIKDGNHHIIKWLDEPLENLIGHHVTDALPELVGSEEVLYRLADDDPPFQLEEIYRPSPDETNAIGNYFDMQIVQMGGGGGDLLVTIVDVSRKARQEALLQQQRNEVQLLSAKLALANERLSFILNRLVPKYVARQLIDDRHLPEPGGGLIRDATILFADMRDFTTFAEVYQPADTLDFLNTYLAIVAEAILRHDGSLVQLVGDMVMGVFNLPEEQPDHAIRAIRAAIDIQDSLDEFNATSDARFPCVSFGVGISTGSAIAGYLGVQQRFRFAVVGDATNVAFHLSSLAAPGRVLLSDATVEALGAGFVVQEKGDFQLKRRKKMVKVYELNIAKSRAQLSDPKAT